MASPERCGCRRDREGKASFSCRGNGPRDEFRWSLMKGVLPSGVGKFILWEESISRRNCQFIKLRPCYMVLAHGFDRFSNITRADEKSQINPYRGKAVQSPITSKAVWQVSGGSFPFLSLSLTSTPVSHGLAEPVLKYNRV